MSDGGLDAALASVREQLDTDERLARAVLDRRAEIGAAHGVTVAFRRQPWMVTDSTFTDTFPPNLPDAASVDALEAAEAEHADRHTAEVVLRRVESDRLILAAVIDLHRGRPCTNGEAPSSPCGLHVAAETIVANMLAARFMAPHYIEVRCDV